MSSSTAASKLLGSSSKARRTAATLRSPSCQGVSTGRNTSSRRRGTSAQRVGRFSYMVWANRPVQNMLSATSRISSYRVP